MKKRIVGIILCVLLSFNCLSVAAFADRTKEITIKPLPKYEGSMEDITDFEDSLSFDFDDFRDDIISQLYQCKAQIDLSKYQIPDNLFYKLNLYITRSIPEAFNIDSESNVSGSTLGGYINCIKYNYYYTSDVYASMREQFEEKADEFLDDIIAATSLTDYQKALLIHDRIVANCDYVGGRQHSFDAYGAIVEGKAVCQGYTLGYMYLLNKVGIENYFCSSDALNHAWNILNIDGDYYHVDVTWDDPSYGVCGNVEHENFLLSTNALYNNYHKATDYDQTPTSTTFDNRFWQDCYCEFQLIGDDIYYISQTDGELRKWNIGSDDTVLATINDKWTVDDSHYYPGCFSKLASDGENLFFSTPDKIMVYDFDDESLFSAYEPTGLTDGYWIYGFTYDDGTFYYAPNAAPEYKSTDSRLVFSYEYEEVVCTLDYKNGFLSYLKNGNVNTEYSGVLVFGGKTYLVKNGIVDVSADSIVMLNGELYHIKNGEIPTTEEPTLFLYNSVLYYFENGQASSKTLIFTYGGVRYYVTNGSVNENGKQFVTAFETHYYFISNGRLRLDGITFTMGDDEEYYSENGIVTYALSNGNYANKLASLTGMILGVNEKNYLYDFSRDEELNILDLVCAKKEISNL